MPNGFTVRQCATVRILPVEERKAMIEKTVAEEIAEEARMSEAPSCALLSGAPMCGLLSGGPKYRNGYALQGADYNFKSARLTGIKLVTSLGGNVESAGHVFGVLASIDNPSDCYINVENILIVDGMPVGSKHRVTAKPKSVEDVVMRLAISDPGTYEVCIVATIVQAWHYAEGNVVVGDYPR
jgi:hypothetical protein